MKKRTQKPYDSQSEQLPEIHEPAIAYIPESEADLKLKALEEILRLNDICAIHKVIDFIQQLAAKPTEQAPCQFTIEELEEEIRQAEEESRQGLGYSSEEVFKDMEAWKQV